MLVATREELMKKVEAFVESGLELCDKWDDRDVMYFMGTDYPFPYRFDEFIENLKEWEIRLKREMFKDDHYLMNNLTAEILPYEDAVKEFNKTHRTEKESVWDE